VCAGQVRQVFLHTFCLSFRSVRRAC
jgi:hypothetical protein